MNSDKLSSSTRFSLDTIRRDLTLLQLRLLEVEEGDDLVADAKNPKKSSEQALKEISLEIDNLVADAKNPKKSSEQELKMILNYNESIRGIFEKLPVNIFEESLVDTYFPEGGAGCTMFGGAQDIKEEEKNAVLKK